MGLGDREHATQSPKARASQDVHEDGLGLVVGGVGYGDAGRVLLMGYAGEEFVAGLAGFFFEG